jgi:hypothetical protein
MLGPNTEMVELTVESRPQIILLVLGCLILIVIGFFPQLFLSGLASVLP